MSKKIKIDPIDEALRIIYLESSSNDNLSPSNSNQLQKIISTDFGIEINTARKEAILNKLHDAVFSMSFGELLTDVMSKETVTAKVLSQKLNINETVIDDLKADRVFTNNIPVVFVKKILEMLNISYKTAEVAVLKTFELLKSQNVLEEVDFKNIHPAFRKGHYTSRENAAWTNNNTVESRDLFENEEALKKYLSRLDELMKKQNG